MDSDAQREPLGDAPTRANRTPGRLSVAEKEALEGRFMVNPLLSSPQSRGPNSTPTRAAPQSADSGRLSPSPVMATRQHDEQKRASDMSGISAASVSQRKTHIGPWQLGKTLGKGSAGRVRLARHYITAEQVAVKILPKRGCEMTQASSLADLDKWDRDKPEYKTEKRMPLSIEREVAILKLIDHPNIMKLYDIWENRAEIYLVLEYVEKGDLFEYINRYGPLAEEETIFFFRQIIGALDYCHSFHICHRDLKPENILITGDGEVKIADFGMAAIQQSPNHRLRTACGSPHYAAPELVNRRTGYHGDKIDIWSAGIILYACLCARLPFDGPDLPQLLAKSRTGIYDEPAELSIGVRMLIRSMLQVDPKHRITIQEIWDTEFMMQYDYMDDLNGKRYTDNLDDIRKHGRSTKVVPEDVDAHTLRQLKSMWHMFTEGELYNKLINDEPNDQKLIYWLLVNYREKRLENYAGDLTHSPSDFHHLRPANPANWKKKFTTASFPAKHGRTPSRFTVISQVPTEDMNALETATDGGQTTRSYDPYKSSRVMDSEIEASHAKITVHRNDSAAVGSLRGKQAQRYPSVSARTNSTYSRRGAQPQPIMAPTNLAYSRRSLTSTRSAEGHPCVRPAAHHKRGVVFSQIRKREPQFDEPHFDIGVNDSNAPIASSNERNAMSQQGRRTRVNTQSLSNFSDIPMDFSPPWTEELSHFSSVIAKDCDEAFNSSPLLPETGTLMDTSFIDTSSPSVQQLSQASYSAAPHTPGQSLPGPSLRRVSRPWDERPLPPAPAPSDSVLREIMEAKQQAERRAGDSTTSPNHVIRMVSHLNRLVPPALNLSQTEQDRRVISAPSSAPIYSQYSTQWGKDAIPLPSINEGQKDPCADIQKDRVEEGRSRAVSAPTWETPDAASTPAAVAKHKGLEYLSRQDKTIRVVDSPSARPRNQSPTKVLAPLSIHKNLSRGITTEAMQSQKQLDLRQRYMQEERREDVIESPSTLQTTVSGSTSAGPIKKRSWFRRTSKEKDDLSGGSKGGSSSENSPVDDAPWTDTFSLSNFPIPPAKKRSFTFAFWRSNKETSNMKLSLGEDDEVEESPSPEPVKLSNRTNRPLHKEQQIEAVARRNIEPQQNWLARLFHIKPATEHLCFNVPRQRTRQEIAALLKDWRRYGIRDVQVDKQRNIVFGRVAKKNYLDIKEVSFAAEIMTVIEHGRRNPLSIVRFTQERGAASSFNRVVETLQSVFEMRGFLVSDKRKVKMMVKTLLNS